MANLTGLRVTVVDDEDVEIECGVIKGAMLPGQWMVFGCQSDKLSKYVNLILPNTPSVIHDALLCEVTLFGRTDAFDYFRSPCSHIFVLKRIKTQGVDNFV